MFGTAFNIHKIPLGSSAMHVFCSRPIIEPVDVVRNLGVMIDAQLSMHQHVSRTAQVCFFHLRRLLSIRRQLGRDVTVKLVVALVF